MSDAFKQFMMEHNARGRVKLDGYTIANIKKLRGDERAKSIEILKDESLNNSSAVEALVAIDPHEASAWLREVISTSDPATLRNRYFIFFWLWTLSSDPLCISQFADSYGSIGDASKIEYFTMADQIGESSELDQVLSSAILVEDDTLVRGIAARVLLKRHGITSSGKNSDYYSKMKVTLKQGSIEERRLGLKELRGS